VQEPPAPISGTQRFGGIGVLVDLPQPGKDRLLILSVYPNSPAERAGLRAHDSLTVVDGEPVKGDEGPAVVARLRGQPDTKVTATVSTPGKGEREVTLTRKVIDPESTITPLIAKTFPNTTIGYIVPNPANMEEMRDEVAAALRSLNNDGQLTGLVLDLRTMRDFSFPIVPMLSLFVTGDKVGSVQSRSTKAQIQISGKGVSGSQNIPMIVLVSELTTGPAESFAGLLQDVGRAKLVGATTRGRTVVVTRAQLPVSGLEMLIPSGEYVGQNGGKWFGKGVTPVILFDQKFEDYNDDSDSQLERAIAELQKQ
jgi:carboxyl-terminal processing protease